MKRAIVVFSILLFIAGCKSGDRVLIGGDSGTQSSAAELAVAAVAPSDVAVDVPLGSAIQVTFSTAVSAGQIGLSLRRGGVSVAGTVTVSGHTAVFTPNTPLQPNATYVATVTGAESGIYSWSFTTGSLRVLESAAGSAGRVQVAANADGCMAAAWEQDDANGNSSIYANVYTPGGGWGQAELIEASTYQARRPQLVVDPWGNVTVIWEQFDGTVNSIYANRYVVGQGWGARILLDTLAYNAALPQLAVDGSGNVVAVWEQMASATLSNIYACRYVFGVGWGTVSNIENLAGAAHKPRVAMDPNGNAVAVWSQSDGTFDSIYYNRMAAGTAWAAAGTLLESATGRAAEPRVVMDDCGTATVVWKQNDGSYESIYYSRCLLGGSWSAAALLENVAAAADEPQLTVSADGKLVAGWVQADGSCRRYL